MAPPGSLWIAMRPTPGTSNRSRHNVAPAARRTRHARYVQNSLEARRAPSTIAENFAHTTSGSTAAWPTQVP